MVEEHIELWKEAWKRIYTTRREGDEIKALEPVIFNMEIRKELDNRDEKELRLEENQETKVSQN